MNSNRTDRLDCEVAVARSLLWIFAILFIAGLLIPVASRIKNQEKEGPSFWNLIKFRAEESLAIRKRGNPDITRTTPSLLDRIEAFEEEIEDSPLHQSSRNSIEHWQAALLREGNRKVYVGHDGWLFYRPGLDALTGYGPIKKEPESVTKNPDLMQWQQPGPVIARFAKQLRDRDIQLMLVPVPDKASIHPEKAGLKTKSLPVHPDREEFFAQLRSEKIQVLDLIPLFEEERAVGRDLFLKQDTHWTPRAMQLVATHISREVQKHISAEANHSHRQKTLERSHPGDLVGMLGSAKDLPFHPETVTLSQILDGESGEKIFPSNPESPVVLLGDSFVNIYEDPSLGFGEPGEDWIGAGLAAHLANQLGYAAHVFAVNGDGATGSRRVFASMPNNIVRTKKLVVWVLAERDLFYSKTAGLDANVLWQDVEFNPENEKDVQQRSSVAFQITATLREKSTIHDPNQVPYKDALYSVIFDQIKVESGSFSEDEITVLLWAFRDKKLLPTANLEIGKRYRLNIAKLADRPKIATINQMDDFLAGQWFSNEIQPQ